MTTEDYLKLLAAEGFSCRLLWEAKEDGQRHANVRSYVVYAPDGMLLTSLVIRAFQPSGRNAVPEIAVYFCSESLEARADIETLRGIWATTLRRQQKGAA
jgi:hypothetical protein